MNHKQSFIPTSGFTAVLSTVLAGAALQLHAQTWQTILGLDGQSSRAMMMDPLASAGDWPSLVVSGEIAGITDSGGTPYKIFRLAQSDAATPSNPDLNPLHASGATVYSMADGSDSLYWAGGLNTSTGNKWIVRRSVDGGGTWQEVHRWSLAAGMFAEARGITVDAAGRLYTCGLALDASGASHWIIQKSEDGGVNWTTKDIFKSSGAASIATGYNIVQGLGATFTSGAGGGLFVVGTRGSKYSGTWTVLRSLDQGSNWQVVDSWVSKSTGSSRARKVASDGARIFVLGDAGGRTEKDPSPWVVRMSTDAGNSWQTIFGPWSDGPCVYPCDFTIDAAGNLWIAGAVTKQYGTTKKTSYTTVATVVRVQESQPGLWVGTEFPITAEAPGTYRAEASAITADAVGHVYVSGSFKANDTSSWQWFLQRCLP